MKNPELLPVSPPDAITGTIDRYEMDQEHLLLTGDFAFAVEDMEERNRSDDVTGKNKKKQHKNKVPPPAPVKEFLTTVTHFCVLAFVFLVWYLCFAHPFVFFTWHPLLMSLGWMFLMTEAILTISKENVVPRKLKLNHDSRILYHWAPLTLAALIIATGFFVVFVNKDRLNKNHFTSWHGLLGLIGVVAYIPPCLNGIALYYCKELKNYIKPKIVKFIHIVSAILSFVCGGISLILSVYTKWFARNTDNSQFLFYFGLIITVFPMVWTTQRPLIKCVKMVYNKFG